MLVKVYRQGFAVNFSCAYNGLVSRRLERLAQAYSEVFAQNQEDCFDSAKALDLPTYCHRNLLSLLSKGFNGKIWIAGLGNCLHPMCPSDTCVPGLLDA